MLIIEYLNIITIVAAFIALIFTTNRKRKAVAEKYSSVSYENYCKTISSNKFKSWRNKVLFEYYESNKFIDLYGKKYPVIIFPSLIEEYPFYFLKKSSLDTATYEDKNIKSSLGKKKFLRIISCVVKRPNNIGYAIKNMKFDENGMFKSFTAYPCTFRDTLITCFYLEYEIYRDYLKNKNKKENKLKDVKVRLKERSLVHSGYSEDEIFRTGKNRNAMLSVQALIVFKSHIDREYKTILIKRSTNVSYAPNTWQIIPCGYFETYEKSNTEYTIKNNFDPTLAILREFLEELFNFEEYIENEDGRPIENITQNEYSLYILDKIEKRTASFIFLGSVLDVITLTHKLSYLLIVDDLEFSKSQFHPNFESNDMQIVPMNEIDEMMKEDLFMPESAGLLSLSLKNNDLKSRLC